MCIRDRSQGVHGHDKSAGEDRPHGWISKCQGDRKGMDKLKKQTKRVILFGIDGAGTFFEQAETPNIDRIFKEGAVSNRTLTELPSISAECWGSMLHGVDCTCLLYTSRCV